jgi:DNA polymerase
MTTLHRDYETRSACDLRTSGVHKYAEDPSTEVLCMSYAVDDGPVKMWRWGEPCPPEFIECAKNPEWLAMAHNSQFEQTMERYLLSKRYGWPVIPRERERCTMVMAHAMSIAASLENAAAATGLEVRKDTEGRKLMMKMAQPRRVTAPGEKTYDADLALAKSDKRIATLLPGGEVAVWWYTAEMMDRLCEYCATDTKVERALEKRLMTLIPSEWDFWVLDQEINDRGIFVDLPAIDNALKIVELEKARLDKEMLFTTNGAVRTCSQAAALLAWLTGQGVPMEAVAKGDVLAALALPGLPEVARKALMLRQEAAKSSTAKLKAMRLGASSNGRVKGTAQFHGASTGRFAGRRLQPQNFPRPSILTDKKSIAIGEVMDMLGDEA